MFKSTFSKYLTAFILIITVSFLILSGIITSMIKGYVTEDSEKNLVMTSLSITSKIEYDEIEELRNYIYYLSQAVIPIINIDDKLEILVVDTDGKVLLSTIDSKRDEISGDRHPIIDGDLGTIDIGIFDEKSTNGNEEYFIHKGNLGGYTETEYTVCATEIVTKSHTRGYVISMHSNETENELIILTRRAVINSCAWVMLAAVIAVYFITERIIHPLKNMTSAAKKFAKGDFETRVTVYGQDEVAELGNAFNNMAESLQNFEKMRNSFLASVSHDLRTPMTTISGFIEGITSGSIPPEKHNHYLGIISSEVHRLSRLVSQLLDISRLESGDRKINPEDFDIAELARITLISFEQKIDDKKLDVSFESFGDSVIAHADKDAIHQVVYNLCHNAIKFADVGGKFDIKIERAENRKIRFSVYDQGQVIPSEDIGHVFESFYKSDKSRGLDKTGVGLGLYICKTIIDAHNENIGVESSDGGTMFYFTLEEGEQIVKRKSS